MWQAAECGIDVCPINIRNLYQIHLQSSQHGWFIPDSEIMRIPAGHQPSGILGLHLLESSQEVLLPYQPRT